MEVKKISVFLLTTVLVLAMITAGIFSSGGISYAKRENSGSSSGSEGSNNEKSSNDGSSNSGNNNNNDNTSPNPGSTLNTNKFTASVNSPVKQEQEQQQQQKDEVGICTTGIKSSCNGPEFDHSPVLPQEKQQTHSQTPDASCDFHPNAAKCAPDKDGNCPPGFSHNDKGNCHPSGPCPAGFFRHTDDESGKCFPKHHRHHHHHHN
jgi:hypothetical protein